MPAAIAPDVVRLALLFDAIKDQVTLLDERCADPRLTTFILAIDALAQRGFSECASEIG